MITAIFFLLSSVTATSVTWDIFDLTDTCVARKAKIISCDAETLEIIDAQSETPQQFQVENLSRMSASRVGKSSRLANVQIATRNGEVLLATQFVSDGKEATLPGALYSQLPQTEIAAVRFDLSPRLDHCWGNFWEQAQREFLANDRIAIARSDALEWHAGIVTSVSATQIFFRESLVQSAAESSSSHANETLALPIKKVVGILYAATEKSRVNDINAPRGRIVTKAGAIYAARDWNITDDIIGDITGEKIEWQGKHGEYSLPLTQLRELEFAVSPRLPLADFSPQFNYSSASAGFAEIFTKFFGGSLAEVPAGTEISFSLENSLSKRVKKLVGQVTIFPGAQASSAVRLTIIGDDKILAEFSLRSAPTRVDLDISENSEIRNLRLVVDAHPDSPEHFPIAPPCALVNLQSLYFVLALE